MGFGRVTRVLRRLIQPGMARSIVGISGASVAAQGLALAVSPILTRLYDPSAFGVFAYISAIVMTISVIAGLRMEMAIPICSSDPEAGKVARLAMLIAATVSIGLLLLVPMFGSEIDDRTPLDLMPALWWAPPSVFALASFTILSQLSIRQRDFGAVARRNFTQAWATAILQVALAATHKAEGLLTGQMLGRGLAASMLAWRNRGLLRERPSARYAELVRRFWRFPAIFTPSALLNTLGLTLPVLMVGAWFGAGSAGQLDLANRMILGPLVLIGAAVSQVLLGEMAARHRAAESPMMPLFKMVALRLTYVAVPFALATALLAPRVFPVLFGPEWLQAGQDARLMAPAAAMSLVAGPLSQAFFIYQKGVQLIVVDTLRVALVAGSGWIAFHSSGDESVVIAAIFGALAVAQGASLFVCWRVVSRGDRLLSLSSDSA